METNKETHTWLIFKAGSETYAIESHLVKELLRNNEVYPLPFVPSYVKGLLNCYGEPFAIVDFSMLQGGSKLDSRLFMILNTDDSLCLQISDIMEFQGDSDATIQSISSGAENSFFTGAIMFDNTSVPVLNLKGIVSKVQADIENS